MSEIYQQLAESFPPEMVRRLNKGGTNLIYIPISEVITRMNKIIGVENWSFTVKSWQQLGTSIVAHVSVQATIEGKTITREGVGGQKIKMSKQGDPVDIGDEVKGAVSDALKKAVQTLGIGLYLARSEEAMEIEQAIDATHNPVPTPVVSPKYSTFKTMLDSLESNKKSDVKTFWTNYSGGRPTPKPSEFTETELDALINEINSYSANIEPAESVIEKQLTSAFPGSTVVAKKESKITAPPRRDID